MRPRETALSTLLLLGLALPGPAAAHAPSSIAPPRFVDVVDIDTEHDAANMSLFVTNIGSLGFDIAQGNAGLEFPIGSGKTAMFASGLWVGAKVAGQTRVTVAEYSMEWGPGRILGGAPEPDSPSLRNFKVSTIHAPAPPDTVGWGAYVTEAAAQGARVGTRRLPVTDTADPTDSVDVPGPDLPGHVAIWSVFNDADPSLHTNNAGSSPPLGLEVRQTVFSRLADDAVYVRWQIANRGANTLEDTYLGFWSDPDLGGAGDDLVGYDVTHRMAYCYNATSNDLQYGANPPALALLFVEGPFDPATQTRRDVYAFSKYISGTDPNSPQQSYDGLLGLDTNTGAVIIDPTTNQPTRFMHTGDPLVGTGWIDTNAADRRMLLSMGPLTLAPGDSTDLVVAFVVQQGNNRLDSVRRLRCYAPAVRDRWLAGMPDPPPAVECPVEAKCPQPASFFAGVCDQPASFPPTTVSLLSACAATSSASYHQSPMFPDWCGALHATGTARERALREYLTLLANVCAGQSGLGLVGPAGSPVGLRGDLAASCPTLGATTIDELLEPAPSLQNFVVADYVNAVDPASPPGYEPVDFGLSAFGGGADGAYFFLSSSLNHTLEPDSFPRVEIVFDPAQPQLAHRYLRLQQADGSIPSNGREYRYGGFREVPFRVRDAATGELLHAAFVERAVTDADGTLLSAAEQFASFDSTWAPTGEFDGGREYLIVYARPYSNVPRPELAVDGAPVSNELPWLYALAARRGAGVVDPGDGFYWDLGHPTSPGIDQYLLDLADSTQSDPDVIAAYDDLASCLFDINAGKTVGVECDATVPAFLSFEGSEVGEDGSVRVAWHAGDRQMGALALERRREPGDWASLGLVTPDGQGRIVYVDTDTRGGDRLSYRLRDPRTHELVAGSGAEVVVPGADEREGVLELAAVVPDGDGVLVTFRLPSAAETRISMYDALGRRVAMLPLGRLEAGAYGKRIANGSNATRSGLYFIRLETAGQRRVAKALLLRR